MFTSPKNYRRFSLILLALFGFVPSMVAQSTRVSGRVVDAETNEPIPFVNVFFANTTIGASTDANGFFSFGRFVPGKYELTITYVGYETYQQALDFTLQREQQVQVAVRVLPKKLNELIVKPDTLGWVQNYREFKRIFLGETANARRCEIRNPKDIHLFRDLETNTLYAHPLAPIQIENKALGYRLLYHLVQFEVSYRTGMTLIFGIPQYQQLKPESKSDSLRWERERKRAYEGSVLHFMRLIQANSLLQEGFEVRIIREYVDESRMDQERIDASLERLRKMALAEGGTKVTSWIIDSLAFYRNEDRKSKVIRVLEPNLLNGHELFGGKQDSVVRYVGTLDIRYMREKRELNYIPPYGEKNLRQHSQFYFLEPVRLFGNGFFDPQRAVVLERYWAWSEKIADMLPLDYLPPKD